MQTVSLGRRWSAWTVRSYFVGKNIAILSSAESAKSMVSVKVKVFNEEHSSRFFFSWCFWYFAYFSMKVYVMGIHLSCLSEALLMSTQSIYFCGEVRKIFVWIFLLSGGMQRDSWNYIIWNRLNPKFDKDTSWLRYELTKNGYVLTRVRIDQKPYGDRSLTRVDQKPYGDRSLTLFKVGMSRDFFFFFFLEGCTLF